MIWSTLRWSRLGNLAHLQGNVIQLIGTWGCALRFFHLLQSCLNGKLEGIPKHRRSIEKGPCGAH